MFIKASDIYADEINGSCLAGRTGRAAGEIRRRKTKTISGKGFGN